MMLCHHRNAVGRPKYAVDDPPSHWHCPDCGDTFPLIGDTDQWAPKQLKDEPYPEGFEAQYEVVPADEPDMDEWDGIGPGPTANDPKRDEHGALIRPVVKVRDGVRDTRSR